MTDRKREVAAYWESHPAGYDEIKQLESNPLAYVEERDRRTRALSPYLEEAYRFSRAKGKLTLDIGCGQGYNAQQLARHGARLSAVDLTSMALQLAVARFRVRGLQANFVQADAEALPFPDATFEFVHSSGAIHHTPDISGAVDEIYRVLKSGGEAVIMVYNKASWRYYWQLMVRLRLRMIALYIFPRNVRERVLSRKPEWRDFVTSSWPTTADVVRAGTEFGGLQNPLSRAYTCRAASALFHRFQVEKFATRGRPYKPFKTQKTQFERLIGSFIDWRNAHWGWYLYIYVRKA